MKKILTGSVFSLLLLSGFAQTQRKCGSYEHYLQQLAADPSFAEKQKNIENFTQDFVRKGGSKSLLQQRGTATYNIPVVVHVVYNTAAQNISDAQIQSQIVALNKDYQLNNSDTAKVPSAFKPLVADCKVQFCLAQRTPAGAATTGIVRKSTTRTSFGTNDAVKKSSTGGDDAWDATQYLNLWVCNLSGGVLGYAQFPGGAAATDGVVILSTAFGTTGTAAAPFNLGRTATHEVGHWLNLRHIWGDDGTACTGSDLVDDTPNQADENYGCPAFPAVSCSNGPNGDMFMNYMDYVDDQCMQMFSLGQRDRMYAVLKSGGSRAALASSQGCVPPTGGTTCNVPAVSAASVITQTGATISWAAATGAVTYNLQYKTSAASAFTTVSGITATSYVLSGLTPATTYTYQVSSVCTSASSAYSTAQSFITLTATTGCSDTYENNNTLAKAAEIAVNTAVTAMIGTSSDKDYFKFSNTASQPNIKISLGNLPYDYDVKLYSPSGTLLKTSQNGGTAAESITYNTSTIGVYKIYVYGYNNAYSATKCYTLQAQAGSSTFRVSVQKQAKKSTIKVYPVPAKGTISLTVDGYDKGDAQVTVINQSGALVFSKKINTDIEQYNTKLDISKLSEGAYYIKVQQGERSNIEKILVH